MSDKFSAGWERPESDMSFRDPTRERNEQGKVSFITLGYVNSPHQDPTQIPMIPFSLNDTEGTIEILEQFAEGIEKLETFKQIYVIYHLHRPIQPQLKVTPPFQSEEYGVFATRFNCRPNPIAMSILELVKIEGNVLHVRGMDMIDGEAVLDIKPYVADFDRIPE